MKGSSFAVKNHQVSVGLAWGKDRIASRASERLVVQECDRIRRQAIRVEGREGNQRLCDPAKLVTLKRAERGSTPDGAF